MKLTVHLMDTQTKETSVYEMTGGDEFHDFIWTEGNYSCNCNRALFFARGRKLVEPLNRPCGEGRYLVKIANETGDVLLDETA